MQGRRLSWENQALLDEIRGVAPRKTEAESDDIAKAHIHAIYRVQTQPEPTGFFAVLGRKIPRFFLSCLPSFFRTQPTHIDTRDASGNTALMWAAAYGRQTIIDELVKNGADINLRNNLGNTALMCATHNVQLLAIVSLLNHGATTLDCAEALRQLALHSPDQGNPAIVAILDAVVKQQDVLRAQNSPLRMSEYDYERVKTHWLQLKALHDKYQEKINRRKAFDEATDRRLPTVLLDLVEGYDAPPLPKLGFFTHSQIHDKLEEVVPGFRVELKR